MPTETSQSLVSSKSWIYCPVRIDADMEFVSNKRISPAIEKLARPQKSDEMEIKVPNITAKLLLQLAFERGFGVTIGTCVTGLAIVAAGAAVTSVQFRRSAWFSSIPAFVKM